MSTVQLSVMAYGGVTTDTFVSIIREISGDRSLNVALHPGDAAVDRARSQIASKFLSSDNDVLVMVDHDIEWDPGSVGYIARHARERKAVVGGLVSKRAYGEGYGGRFVDIEEGEIGADKLIELPEDNYVGAAFMAIHKSVFVRIGEMGLPLCERQQMWPFFMPQVKFNEKFGGEEYLSEDWSFCHYARAAGAKVYLALKPVIVHHGHAGYTVIDGRPGHRRGA